MSGPLRVQRGGEGDPVLVLLHGMGATGDVWSGLHQVLRDRWPGRWVTPDLPGHGQSAPPSRYSFGHFAAEVAAVVPDSERVVVLGHSMGGVVALTLATGWFGVRVAGVIGLGIKVEWSGEELARAKVLASRPNPVFPTRREAAERYLKVAGLTGLVSAELVGDSCVRQDETGWSHAFDPAAFGVGAPDMASLLAANRARVVLAAGEHDPMSRPEQLRRLVPDPVILPGLGHNAQVEVPDALWPVLEQLAAGFAA
jgi:pimeloyl-ACP methyl ester carboxylesterase